MAINFQTDGRLYLGSSNTIPGGTNAFSAVALISFDSLATNDPRIVLKATSTATDDHDWSLYAREEGSGRFHARIRTGSGPTSTENAGDNTLPADGVLKACGWAWNGGSSINMYVGESLVASPAISDNGALATRTIDHAIGDNPTGTVGQRGWRGRILEVRIYTRFIDLVEFQAYHRSLGRVISHAGLLHWWKFHGEEGNAITVDEVNDLVEGLLNGVSVDGTAPSFTGDGIPRRRYS